MAKYIRKKRKLGSYPFGSVIFSITLAIFVMGIFGLLFIYSQGLIRTVQSNVEMQVYLHKQIPQVDIDFLQRLISESGYVRKEDGSAKIRFVSKEEAADIFIEETGEDFRNFISDNPLRDALVVSISREYQIPDSMELVKKKFEVQRGVYEVDYEQSFVESINRNLATLGLIFGGIVLILLIVVVILINNTIRLAMFSQRFLIRSMQLVGATGRFIRRPFLMRAMGYGTIAGLISVALLFGFITYGNFKIQDLELLQDFNSLYALFGMLVFLGALVGYFSTLWAVKKYLKMSLDELY